MALQIKCGNFTLPTATGAFDTVVGFDPVALILFCTPQTTNNAYGAGSYFCWGMGTRRGGATQSRSGWLAEDQAATTNQHARMSANMLEITNTGTGTVRDTLTLTDFVVTGGGFTLNHTVTSSVAYIIHYIAIGGADLTDAEVFDFETAAAFGNQTITTNFQGDAVIFFGPNTSGTATLPFASATDPGLNFGIATSSTKRGCWSRGTRDARTDITSFGSTQRTDRCLRNLARNAGKHSSDFVSFGATNFVINIIDDFGGALPLINKFACLLLKGGQWEAGVGTDPNAAAPTTSVHTTAFQPTGVILSGWNRAANTAIISSAGKQTFGGMSAAGENQAINGSVTAINNVDEISEIVACLVHANSGASLDEADFNAFGATSFTLDWPVNSTAILEEFLWLAGGNNAAAAVLPPLPTIVRDAARRAASW